MNNECEIVRDLLPLYAENLTSEASVSFIQSHVAHCDGCQKALQKLKEPIPIVPDTDVNVLQKLKSKIRKRIVLPVLATILLMLTLLTGMVISATVPVWVSAEEAIVFVEQEENGRVRVKLSDSVCSIVYLEDNRFCCRAVRLNWLLKFYRTRIFNNQDNYLYFDLDAEDSLWYAGQYTGDTDTLLWGSNVLFVEGVYYEGSDQSLLYITIVCLCLGSLLLICGVFLRKKKLHTLLMILAALLLCCGASCVFVTGGYFRELSIPHMSMIKFSNLIKQYLAIAGMSLVSFLTVISCSLALKVNRDQ